MKFLYTIDIKLPFSFPFFLVDGISWEILSKLFSSHINIHVFSFLLLLLLISPSASVFHVVCLYVYLFSNHVRQMVKNFSFCYTFIYIYKFFVVDVVNSHWLAECVFSLLFFNLTYVHFWFHLFFVVGVVTL